MFDVDGVLVDVRESFFAAIVAAVQAVVLDRRRLRDDGALVRPSTIAAFKAAGGYNNDWDLAYALALWYVGALRRGHRTTSDLRRDAGRADLAARRPLGRLETAVRDELRPTFEEVKGLMLELYWGSADAARRFGVAARLARAEPLRLRERVLLRAETVAALRALGIRRFGILTGRLEVEWQAIRRAVPLPADLPAVTAEDGTKPDPRLLARLVRSLGARRPCYVGDVPDDWRLVTAYNATPLGRARPATAALVCDGAIRRALRRAGASLFARDVNELPRLLQGVGRRRA